MRQNMRRWVEGMQGEISGVPYRIVEGSRGMGTEGTKDLRLDIAPNGQWIPLDKQFLAFAVDFLYENEHLRCPPPMQGGNKIISYLKDAAKHGYEAAERLHGATLPGLEDY